MFPNKKRKLVKFFPITEKRETFPLNVVGTTVGLQLGVGEGTPVIDGKTVGRTFGFQVGSGETKMVGSLVGRNTNELVGPPVGSQVGTSDCTPEEAAVERMVGIAEGADVIEGINAVLCEVESKDGQELG
jgi:hypothetical protein